MSLFNSTRKGLGFLSEDAPMCRACPHTKNIVELAGHGQQEILVVVDSPSETEAFTKKAFIGSKYDETDNILSSIGFSLTDDCWKLHASACFDANEKKLDKAVECCRPYFESKVKSLKPKLILCFGGAASKAVLGSRFSDTSVGRWRGIPLFHTAFNCWVMITYDPSWNADARTYATYQAVIESDIRIGIEHLNKRHPWKLTPNIKTLTKYDDIVFELQNLLDKAEEVSVDYETTGLKPQNKGHRIVANSFTYTYENGKKIRTISYPIAYKGMFNKKERREIKRLTGLVLQSNIPKIGHHSKFEDIWGSVYFGVKTNNWTWCTMYTAHLLDERPNHVSLKTQAFINFQAEPYEEKTKKYLQAPAGSGGNGFNTVDKCNILDLLYYNGLDTYYTHLLYRKQKAVIRKNPTLAPITELFLEGALLFSDMEQAGFGVVPDYFQEKQKEIKLLIKEKKRLILDTKEARKFNKQYKVPFSFRSDDHLNKMIYGVLGTEKFKTTKTGKGSTDSEVLAFLEKQGSVFAKEYTEYSRLCKARDTFISQMLLETDENWVMHPMYSLSSTRTGRSCVAKGTHIEVVRDLSINPKGICIEDVKEGDLVYCFDKNRKPTIRKVLWAGKTGTREIVEVHWKAAGSGRTGVLKVTTEHRIRMINGKYVQAKNILKKDRRDFSISGKHSPKHRTLAMSRKKDNLSLVYFSGKNSDPIHDHRFVYSKTKGKVEVGNIIHHKDFNHLNNIPDNLLKMSNRCHSQLHGCSASDEVNEKRARPLKSYIKNRTHWPSGPDCGTWREVSKLEMYRMLYKANGEYSKIPMDFETTKKKCDYIGVDCKKIKSRFSKNFGYITRGFLTRNAGIDRNTLAKTIGCAPSKVNKIFKERGICYEWWEGRTHNNHIITDVIYTGEVVDVYDIEVEGCHNFIANEICVHNSSNSPNWQNLPKRNKYIMNLIRGGIKAPVEGHKFCEADYGSLEVRVAACYTKDPVLIKYILDESTDMHRDSATDLFFMPTDKVSKMARFFAKNGFVFANFYGSSAKSAAKNLWKTLPEIFDVDNVPVFDYLTENDIYDYKDFEEHIIEIQEKFWKKFKVFKQWQLETVEEYKENGFIESKHGFRRRGVLGYNEIINTKIQGSAFLFLLWSAIQVNNIRKKECWKSKVIGQIHDSLLTSIEPEEERHVTQTIRYVMEEKVREQYPWICVPMVAEFEITGPNGTWNTMKPTQVEYDKKFRRW